MGGGDRCRIRGEQVGVATGEMCEVDCGQNRQEATNGPTGG